MDVVEFDEASKVGPKLVWVPVEAQLFDWLLEGSLKDIDVGAVIVQAPSVDVAVAAAAYDVLQQFKVEKGGDERSDLGFLLADQSPIIFENADGRLLPDKIEVLPDLEAFVEAGLEEYLLVDWNVVRVR